MSYADATRPDDADCWQTRRHLFADIEALAAFVEGTGVQVAIDVTIGLLDSVDCRACDLAARGLITARASAVFAPPAIVGAAAMVPAAAIATTTRPQGAQLMAQRPALSSSATIVAASAIRWSLAQGGPIAARGPSRISSARSASLLTARASTFLAS